MRRVAKRPHVQWRPEDHRGRLGLPGITEDGLFPGMVRMLAETQGFSRRRDGAVLQYAMWPEGLAGRRGWSTARPGVHVRCWLPAVLRRESELASPSRRITRVAWIDQFGACRSAASAEPEHLGSHRCSQGWLPRTSPVGCSLKG